MTTYTTHSVLPPRTPRSLRCALIALAAFAAPAIAQDLTVKAPPQAQAIVIANVTVHPVTGPDVEHATIVFDKGVIKTIASGAVSAPAGARTIDGKGSHVYPGMIAAYTQLGLTEIQAIPATNDTSETGNITPEVRAADAVNPDSNLLTVTRSNGVLVAGVFPGGGSVSGQGGAIRLDGWTTRDMTINPSVSMVVRWPNVRTVSAWWMDRSEEDQMKDIREGLAAIERTFDTAKAYADLRDSDPNATVDLRWEAMRGMFAAEGKPKLPVFFQASDLDQINSCVQFGAQRGLKMVIVGGRGADQAAELLKQHNVMVIVQGTNVMPRRDDAAYDDGYALCARLHAAGVSFCIANGDDTAHERNLPYSAATAVAHGLPYEEGLKAVTINAAKVLGIDGQYGSLEVGKSATLIVTTGDPLEVVSQVTMAFIDGREIDLSNKQSVLAKKYMERYRQTGDIKQK